MSYLNNFKSPEDVFKPEALIKMNNDLDEARRHLSMIKTSREQLNLSGKLQEDVKLAVECIKQMIDKTIKLQEMAINEIMFVIDLAEKEKKND